jgi:hypothetical protein
MSTLKPSYGSNTAITITLTSLANSTSLSTGYRQSAAVDNTSNLFCDFMIYGHVKSAGTPTANAIYSVFLVWSNDGGTTYSNNASGSDAAYTQPDSDNNMIVGSTSVCTAVSGLVSYFPPFSFMRRADLTIPPSKWAIVFKDGSGQALTATSTDHVFSYMGVNWTNV